MVRMLIAGLVIAAGCGDDDGAGPRDGGRRDAGGGEDAGRTDAGARDAGPRPDASVPPGCAFAPPPQTGRGRTWYVAPAGDDGAEGSETAPFATLQHAADVAGAGDTIIAEDGAYTATGETILYVSTGGTADDWLWIRARNRWGAHLDGRDGTNASGIRFGDGVGWVRVEGFEISGMQAGDGGAGGIECYAGGHDVELIGNHIHHIGRFCTDTANGEVGIFLQQADVLVEGNLLHDIGRFAAGEMGCMPTTMYWQNHDHGIYVDGDVPGADRATIRNNVFYGFERGWAIQLYPGTLEGVRIEHNTFVGPNPYRDGHIVADAAFTDLVVRNNLFFEPRASAISASDSPTFTSSIVTHNCISTDAVFNVPDPGGVMVADNILGIDPLFVDAAGRDYHLAAGSPAADVGAMLPEVIRDFDGCARPMGGGWDCGAFER